MRLIRNRGQDEWLLGFGKLGFGRKAAKQRIRRGSSAVSFQLSYSSSLVAPDLTLSTFWLRQMPTALMSIGLKPNCREPIGTPAVLKSLTQAGDVIHPMRQPSPRVSAADNTSAMLLRVAKSRRRVPLADRCDGIAHSARQEGRRYRLRRVQSTAQLVAGEAGDKLRPQRLQLLTQLKQLVSCRTGTIGCSRGGAGRAPRSEMSKARDRFGPQSVGS